LRELCAREHAKCFACRPISEGGLGLEFDVQPDGTVESAWICPSGVESYAGIVHGGILATALDSAMVHVLFASGIIARTGELRIRYRRSVRTGTPARVTARLCDALRPLFRLEAEIRQDGIVCTQATAKFMALEFTPVAMAVAPTREAATQ
jgi:acyl-coenzyme A thioesterase PaaI-like protein